MPRWTESELRAAVATSDSLGEVLRAFGLRAAGGNYRQITTAIERWDISIAHFTYRRRRRAPSGSVGIPLVEVLIEHSGYHRGSLKRRLYAEGFKQRCCELCGQGEEWNGARIALILDHVNGVHDDNRLENLRIVCPNCNATLPTHCGRTVKPTHPPRPCDACGLEFHPGRPETRFCSRACWHRTRRAVPRPELRRVERPPHEQLLAEIAATSWSAVGRKYGVSDNSGPQVGARRGAGSSCRARAEHDRQSAGRGPIARIGPGGRIGSRAVSFTAVVMAAGQGTRMRSQLPKVLHPVCGRPMLHWPVLAAQEAGAEKVVVVGSPDGALEGRLPEGVVLAVQPVADGTGGAVRAASEYLEEEEAVVVLSGDVPLVSAEVLRTLVDSHLAAGDAATMVTTRLDDPTGYGRVVRDTTGGVLRVVETKTPGDATKRELAILEVNVGIFCFEPGALRRALKNLDDDNSQHEYYLPDTLPLLRHEGLHVAAHPIDDPGLVLGVNDRVQLARVTAVAQHRILLRHMRAGVTVIDPASTSVDADVELGVDTVLEPGCALRGRTRVGERCRLGPHTTLIDTQLGAEVSAAHSYATGAVVEDAVSVGPFAYLRPGAVLRNGSKVGTFVEIKNSDIGEGAKVPHLSYVGDTDVGARSNLGAGTITANYDGHTKHRTTIGEGVRGGVDTSFVAPVSVGDGAWTAAGSVVTEDVPPGALAVARARQRNVSDYAPPSERPGTVEEPESPS